MFWLLIRCGKRYEGVRLREGVFMHIYFGGNNGVGSTECVPYTIHTARKGKNQFLSEQVSKSRQVRFIELQLSCHVYKVIKVKQKVSTTYSKHLCS